MFTQNAPAAAMRGQLVELRAGARMTIGGSSESAANDWQVKPDGQPVLERRDDGDAGGEVAEHLAEPGLVEARHEPGARPYALPRSIDWDSCAEDTSSTCLASGSRRAWFRMRSSSRSVCEGSWCESRRRFTPASAATCTA